MWSLLKDKFEGFVGTVVYSQLCFSSSKQQQWEADPVEYVRASVGMAYSPFMCFLLMVLFL